MKKLSKIFLVLLLVAIILRFWKMGELFIFDLDEEYLALLGWSLVKDFHIVWIGVSASNIGYYLGPGLNYLTALLLWVSHGDPISLGYFAATMSILTLISLYFIGYKFFSKQTALIASTIYTFSTFIIYYDRKFWPIFVPLIALWLFFSLVQAKRDSRWLILTSTLLGAAYHIHLSLLIFWPFFVWGIFQNRKKIKLFHWFLMISSYLLVTLPLLVFDFLHNFDNLLLPLRFLQKTTSNQTIGTGKSSIYFLGDILSKIIYSRANTKPIIYWLLIILLVTTTYLFVRKLSNKNYAYKLLGIFLFVLSLAVILYPGPLQEYYAVIFIPFVVLMIAVVLNNFPRVLQIILLGLFMTINLFSYKYFTNQTTHGLANKKRFIQKVTTQISSEYSLSTDSDYRNFAGWRYLFQAYGKTPAQSSADEMFGWIYQDEISASTPPTKLILSREKDLKIKAERISQPPYYGYIIR